jgi:hypothetical protein
MMKLKRGELYRRFPREFIDGLEEGFKRGIQMALDLKAQGIDPKTYFITNVAKEAAKAMEKDGKVKNNILINHLDSFLKKNQN